MKLIDWLFGALAGWTVSQCINTPVIACCFLILICALFDAVRTSLKGTTIDRLWRDSFFIRQCSWCRDIYCWPKFCLGKPTISHGICRHCAQKFQTESLNLNK